jgi:hypothetical protein
MSVNDLLGVGGTDTRKSSQLLFAGGIDVNRIGSSRLLLVAAPLLTGGLMAELLWAMRTSVGPGPKGPTRENKCAQEPSMGI